MMDIHEIEDQEQKALAVRSTAPWLVLDRSSYLIDVASRVFAWYSVTSQARMLRHCPEHRVFEARDPAGRRGVLMIGPWAERRRWARRRYLSLLAVLALVVVAITVMVLADPHGIAVTLTTLVLWSIIVVCLPFGLWLAAWNRQFKRGLRLDRWLRANPAAWGSSVLAVSPRRHGIGTRLVVDAAAQVPADVGPIVIVARDSATDGYYQTIGAQPLHDSSGWVPGVWCWRNADEIVARTADRHTDA